MPTQASQQRYSEALAALRDPAAVDVLAAALNYLGPPARYGAAEALGAIGLPNAVPALAQLFDSDDPVSRQKAAQALLEIGSPEALNALSTIMADPDPRLRELAVRGLGLAGGEPAVLSLIPRLDDPEEPVRIAAAAALAGIGEPSAAPVMLTALGASSSFAQQSIAHALGGYAGDEIKTRLLVLMNQEGDLRLRLTAAQSLVRLRDERGAAMILRTLNAPNRETRRLAAIAFGLSGDPRAVEPLLDSILQGLPDAAAAEGRAQRRRMLAAIASLGSAIAARLIELLDSGDQGLRAFATDGLLRLGADGVDMLITALAGSPKVSVRVDAARLLGQIGDERAVEPLSRALREALIGPFPLVFFLRLLVDRSTPVRAAAAAALGEIGSLDGAALLLAAARYDPDEAVNGAAETALARIGSPAVIARLARPDAGVLLNRAFAAGLALVLAGGLAGAAIRLWGVPGAAVVGGLVAAAVLGWADGLEGRRRTVRIGLSGGLAGLAAAWIFSLAGVPGWAGTAAAALLPAVGALIGRSQAVPAQRLAGVFGGIVLGLIGTGAAGLLLSTIGP